MRNIKVNINKIFENHEMDNIDKQRSIKELFSMMLKSLGLNLTVDVWINSDFQLEDSHPEEDFELETKIKEILNCTDWLIKEHNVS